VTFLGDFSFVRIFLKNYRVTITTTLDTSRSENIMVLLARRGFFCMHVFSSIFWKVVCCHGLLLHCDAWNLISNCTGNINKQWWKHSWSQIYLRPCHKVYTVSPLIATYETVLSNVVVSEKDFSLIVNGQSSTRNCSEIMINYQGRRKLRKVGGAGSEGHFSKKKGN
jgi:hypothetical protein